MVEREKKILLTSGEYYYLILLGQYCLKTEEQVNYYYDTEDYSFDKKGITCRIRQKNGQHHATIKRHSLKDPNVSIEKKCLVNDAFDITFFRDLGVKYHGNLTTKRSTVVPCYGVTVCLDKNTYLNKIDYELEVEYKEDAEKVAEMVIKEIAKRLVLVAATKCEEEFMDRINAGPNKSQRFFEGKMLIDNEKDDA